MWVKMSVVYRVRCPESLVEYQDCLPPECEIGLFSDASFPKTALNRVSLPFVQQACFGLHALSRLLNASGKVKIKIVQQEPRGVFY